MSGKAKKGEAAAPARKDRAKAEGGQVSPFVAEMLAGITEFCDHVDAGRPIREKFTVRKVDMGPESGPLTAEEFRAFRSGLDASQPVLARFLGVSSNALRSWEQGSRPVPAIARRHVEILTRRPEIFREWIEEAAARKKS